MAVVFGSQVYETDTARGRAVGAGAQAAETDTANAGVPVVVIPGSRASETYTANTTPTTWVPGSRAVESYTVEPGGTRRVVVPPATTYNVVSFVLGRPPAAALRGGDCRARDLDQNRNVHGPHRFAATTHCQISNGLLRLTVRAAAAAPALTIEAWRGRVVINDVFTDVFHDDYGGEIAEPAWVPMGVLTIDSPSVSALLTGVRLASVTPEKITLRLVAPLMADAYVSLRRGERQCRIQHGSTRAPLVDINRRLRWTDTPAPVGTQVFHRVEETEPANDGMRRYLGALDAVTPDASTFSLTAASVTTARLGAGAATYALGDRSIDMHRQLADASRPRLVVA